MTFEIVYPDNGLGIIRSFSEHLTGSEVIATLHETLSSPELIEKIKYSLADFSGVTDVTISKEEVQIISDLAVRIAKLNKDILVAVVGPQDLVFGLARMWQTHSDQSALDILVTRSRTEAENWIKQQGKSRFDLDLTFI